MADEDRDTPSEEAFALLGHEIRLDILRAFFDAFAPVDPDTRDEVRARRTRSYADLMAATDVGDSGKFNYHLERLRGVYVEQVDGGYVPTASAVALYEAVLANRPTEDATTDVSVEERCPACGAGLRAGYEQEYLTVECPDCDEFWGISYRFPKNGLAVRDGDGVFEALYDRLMHHVGLARTGQCPSCAGVTRVDLPRDRLDGESTPTVEMTCATCSWLATVDVLSALEGEPRVSRALLEVGVPLAEGHVTDATERVHPAVTGQRTATDPFSATVSVATDDTVAEIVVDGDLRVESVTVR